MAASGRPCANLQKPSQFGLLSATREHEVGIASNRGSACRGEYVPGPCTHRPSHHGSWLYLKAARQPWGNLGRQPTTVRSATGVKSEQGSRRGTCGWITSVL